MTCYLQKHRGFGGPFRHGFTLIELLVVLLIFSILTGIALPLAKSLISDEKVTRTSQNIESFLNVARNRAIAEGRPHGVRIERLGVEGSLRSMSTQLRFLKGVPAYSGDSADATALVSASTSSSGIDTLEFNVADSPLLYLSFQMLLSTDPAENARSPIQYGDLIELPGGFLAPIERNGISGDTSSIFVRLLPRNDVLHPVTGLPTGTFRFPDVLRNPIPGSANQVKYQIHRRPTPSTSGVLSLPRGMVVDLNYSGIGLAGNNFAPTTSSGDVPSSVDVLFNSDGAVSEVIVGGSRLQPQGQIFLLVGRIDGVADVDGATAADRENLFASAKPFIANIMDDQSIWLVINQSSGQASSVANVPVTTIPAVTTDARPLVQAAIDELSNAMRQSRLFTTFSDSIGG